jgi:hypothetical protein
MSLYRYNLFCPNKNWTSYNLTDKNSDEMFEWYYKRETCISQLCEFNDDEYTCNIIPLNKTVDINYFWCVLYSIKILLNITKQHNEYIVPIEIIKKNYHYKDYIICTNDTELNILNLFFSNNLFDYLNNNINNNNNVIKLNYIGFNILYPKTLFFFTEDIVEYLDNLNKLNYTSKLCIKDLNNFNFSLRNQVLTNKDILYYIKSFF